MRSKPAAFLALALATAGVQAAEPSQASADTTDPADPAEWLLKASESSRHVSYQGVVVYRDSDTIETLRVVHRHKDGREQERLTSLSGTPRDTVRDDEHTNCALAHDHPAAAGDSPQNLLPALSRKILREVAEHYGFRTLGEARVAGRISRGVSIDPRDEFRYGYEVWADRETAVALKVSLLDSKGRVIEQMMYTEIHYPARIADSAFTLAPGVRRLAPPPRAPAPPLASQAAQVPASNAAAGSWSLAGLPPGFRIVMRSLKPAPEGEGAVEHVLLSDGLSAVSVFSARMPQQDKLFRGFSHMGAMNAYGRTVGVFHVTVVGEVPQATVRMIGDGLKPVEQ
jgi:sigma-E factor negative regulatory protein RseB